MGTGRTLSETLLGQSETARKLQQFALLGTATLALLLTGFAGWYWWPWLWGLIPLVVVVLPGIRRLIDELWGLLAGLLAVALVLSSHVEASAASLAWSLAAAVTAGGVATWRRGGIVPLVAVGVTVAAVIASTAVWWSGENQRDAAAELQAQLFHEQQVAKLRPHRPQGVVTALVEAVATPAERADRACIVFSPEAAREFADAHHAPDCVSALQALSRQVRDFDVYVNQLGLPANAVTYSGPRMSNATVDACHLEFGNVLSGDMPTAGPQLGRLDMVQQYGEGYLVTDYQPCPAGA